MFLKKSLIFRVSSFLYLISMRRSSDLGAVPAEQSSTTSKGFFGYD